MILMIIILTLSSSVDCSKSPYNNDNNIIARLRAQERRCYARAATAASLAKKKMTTKTTKKKKNNGKSSILAREGGYRSYEELPIPRMEDEKQQQQEITKGATEETTTTTTTTTKTTTTTTTKPLSSTTTKPQPSSSSGSSSKTTNDPFFVFPRKKGRILWNFSPGDSLLLQPQEQFNHDNAFRSSSSSSSSPKKSKEITNSAAAAAAAAAAAMGSSSSSFSSSSSTTTSTFLSPSSSSLFSPPNDYYFSITLNPFSMIRFMKLGITVLGSFTGAFMGTLRLLAPLIFARRVLNLLGEFVIDYLTGRYLRTTYKSIEHKYWKPYQIPDASRSLARTIVHMFAFFQIGKFMESMIGLLRKPCVLQSGIIFGNVNGVGIDGSSCHWWCAMLWIILVVGIGEVFGLAMEVYGGPLKIREAIPNYYYSNTSRMFTRPGHILNVLRDPDQWISRVTMERKFIFATSDQNHHNGYPQHQHQHQQYHPHNKPFRPDPMLFPATWKPLHALLFISVAKSMASTDNTKAMHYLMKLLLIQQTFHHEWYRVFMNEKRIVLGAISNVCTFVATTVLFLFVTLYCDHLAGVVMIPTFLSVIFSAWMNVLFCWERHFAGKRIRHRNNHHHHHHHNNNNNNNNNNNKRVLFPSWSNRPNIKQESPVLQITW